MLLILVLLWGWQCAIMNRDINLLRSKKKSFLSEAIFLKRFRLTAFTLLGIVAVLSVIVFILTITSGKSFLLQQKQNAARNLSLMDKKSLQLLLVKNNLKDINTFLGKQSSLNSIIEFVSQNLPSTIALNLFTIDKQSITMNLRGSSLPAFSDFFNQLSTFGIEQKLFERVVLDSFSFDSGGKNYNASLTIVIL